MKRLTMLVAALMVFSAGAETTTSIEKQAEPWPALVDGRRLTKVFRFKPSRVEYIPEGKIIESYLVVFHINDAAVPANRFAFSRDGSEDRVRTEVENLLAADDEHVTVDATWVNRPVNFVLPGEAYSRRMEPYLRLFHRSLLFGELRWLTPNTE